MILKHTAEKGLRPTPIQFSADDGLQGEVYGKRFFEVSFVVKENCGSRKADRKRNNTAKSLPVL